MFLLAPYSQTLNVLCVVNGNLWLLATLFLLFYSFIFVFLVEFMEMMAPGLDFVTLSKEHVHALLI